MDDLVKRLREPFMHVKHGQDLLEAWRLERAEAADRIEELESKLLSATMDGYDMAKHEYRDRIEELEDKLATCEKYRDAYAECARIGAQDVFGLETKLAECEARLEKAVDALDEAVYLLAPDEKDMMRQAGVYRVVTTLAELKGQRDE